MTPETTPIRALIVSPFSDLTGAPTVAARIAEGLDPARFECLTVFPAPGDAPNRLRARGCAVCVLGLVPTSFRDAEGVGARWNWLRSRWTYARNLADTARRFRPHVMYVHSSVQPLPGLVGLWRRVPVLWHVHESRATLGAAFESRRRWVKRLSRGVVFCSHSSREAFGQQPAGQIWETVPNAVELDRFGPSPSWAAARGRTREALGLPPDRFVALFVGSFAPAKGMDILIEALRRCREAGRADWTLLGAGARPPRAADFAARVEDAIRRHGMTDAVRWLGPRNDVPDLMAAADAFVLPSRAEAMPLSLAEAFAAGLPSVCTDVGDCARLAGDGRRALCVAPDDPAAFAEALLRLMTDPDLGRRMGTEAREFAREHFSMTAFIESISDIIERVAGWKSSGGGAVGGQGDGP